MHADARRLVESLGLIAHPEGGFYRETFRSKLTVKGPTGERVASTAIYFLLPAGTFSAWHCVEADEAWHFYAGDALELFTIDSAGTLEVSRLGTDFAKGERPQIVVPSGVLQAARPTGNRFSLCGCTVAPGFEFADFAMPPRHDLLRRHPAHRAVIEALTRDDA